MRVKCLRTYPTEDEIAAMDGFYRDQQFSVRRGEVYTVFAISFDIKSKLFGTCTVLLLPGEFDRLMMVPLGMFEVVDARISPTWRIKSFSDGGVLLGAPEYLANECFGDDLFERVGDVHTIYLRILERLDAE